MRILLLVAFFASLLSLPWYVPVVLGVFLIAYYEAYLSVLVGGVILDSMFGAPVPTLSGFAFIYTALFALLSLIAFFLRRVMME